MNSLRFLCLLVLFVLAQHAVSQSKTLSEFLATIPQPPKNVSEALRRCIGDKDTVVRRSSIQASELDMAERKAIARDSSVQAKAATKGTLSMLETNEMNTLRALIENSLKQLSTTLQQITSSPSQILLGDIRSIGESLDKEITDCPKKGDRQILDSVCIEAAEAKAQRLRIESSEKFLQTVNNEWVPMFKEVKRTIENQEKHISQRASSSKKIGSSYRLSMLRNTLWKNVELLLKSTQDITRLATQFNH